VPRNHETTIVSNCNSFARNFDINAPASGRRCHRTVSHLEFPFSCGKGEKTLQQPQTKTKKRMKIINKLFITKSPFAKLNTCLAATVTVGILALGAAGLSTPVQADPYFKCQDNRGFQELAKILQEADVAELDQLAADFHGALSYGGNITAMMSLWTDNSSITLNGTAHVGKANVQAFFQSSGYFLNNWVSLAPEYKTVITVHGNTATITTQCVAIDLSVSPMVVKSVIQVNATCARIGGKWLFTSMNNTSGAPL
jgi:hypothetical protein